MPKQAVYDYSTTPASNTDIDGLDSTGATGRVSSGDNYARSLMSHLKGFALDLGAANTVAGTADAITVALASAPSALVTGMTFSFVASATNTGAVTLNPTPAGGSALGAKAVRKIRGGTDIALVAGDLTAGRGYQVRYSSTANGGAGAWIADDASFPVEVTNDWTPTILFGGANTGLAGTFTGRVVKIGKLVDCSVSIVLTNKGSSTGTAVIANLPYLPATKSSWRFAGRVGYFLNMSGLTAGASCGGFSNSFSVSLYANSSTSSAVMTDANFTNTSQLDISISYEAAS